MLLFGFKLYLFLLFKLFFYGDYTDFIYSVLPWAYHGGKWNNGLIAGEFAFTRNTGLSLQNDGSRLCDTIICCIFSYYNY